MYLDPMNQMDIPYTSILKQDTPLERISSALNEQPKHRLLHEPWPLAGTKPEVSFAVVYGSDGLYVKYFVTEGEHKAQYLKANDPVYKDSCVELFLSFGDETAYYNIECNSLGTILAAFGPDRHNRAYLSANTINLIRYSAVLTSSKQSSPAFSWELTLVIPFSFFCHHQLTSLKGMTAKANFYKCGDDLPHPHYLCWNHIQNAKPDFHLREFFGSISFI